jgi:tetratricopeptide (TPR) repeat protein
MHPEKNSSNRSRKLLGNYWQMFQKYPLAAGLMEAGASGENAANTAADAVTFRKTQHHTQIRFPTDPEGTAMRIYLLQMDPDLTLEQLRSECSRNGKLAFATPSDVEQLIKEEKDLLTYKARAGLFTDIGIDTSIATAQSKTQGDDLTGYKVTLWPAANYKYSIYVVKEEDKYKVLATSQFPAGVGLEVLDRVASGDLASARSLLDWLREDQGLAGGDDPLWGLPFPRFWTKGRNAEARAMELAAASILVASKGTAARGIAILDGAAGSANNEAEKLNIFIAQLFGYMRLDEYEKALSVSTDLVRRFPESKWAFTNQMLDLRALGRFAEADRLAEDRLQHIPGDLEAMRALVWSAITREDYLKAHALDQNILEAGKAEPGDLNGIAWVSLFTGKVEGSDLEDALKAAQLSQNNAAMLHTLGCVYAEVGKTKEAREVLIQAMDSLNLEEPDENYWYAFGRIAEQYGEYDAARSDYMRVTRPKKQIDIHDSSYQLAQIRLKAMGSVAQVQSPTTK